MSSPSKLSVEALKRLGRYLVRRPRLVFKYPFQETLDGVDVYGDTDHAGCLRTRKSTSGGCVMVGTHLIKSWASTQPTITLSSGEAELYGVVRAAANGLGYLSLLADLGIHLRLRVWTDSTASQGMCGRQGLGKVRHLDVQELWVQQRVRNRDFDLFKIKGEENPGDLFTKAGLAESRITELLRLLNCEYRDGRAAAAPALRQEGGTKCFVLNRGRQSGGRRSGKERDNKGITPQCPRNVPQQYSTTTAAGPTPTVHSYGRRGSGARPKSLQSVSPKSFLSTADGPNPPAQSEEFVLRRQQRTGRRRVYPTLERARPSVAAVASELQSKRWADEPEEEGEYTEEQVRDMLRAVLKLPHLVLDGRTCEPATPAVPEAEEPEDPVTAEGLAIGRHRAGRQGLPCRLQASESPQHAFAEEGQRSYKASRGPSEVS